MGRGRRSRFHFDSGISVVAIAPDRSGDRDSSPTRIEISSRSRTGERSRPLLQRRKLPSCPSILGCTRI